MQGEKRHLTKRSRALVAASCVLVFAIALWFTFFRASEEDKVRRTLDRFVEVVRVKPGDNLLARAGRLRSGFKELVSEDVHVDVPDLGIRLTSRDKLAEGATAAAAAYTSADATLTNVRIRIDESNTTAKADVLLLMTAERGGDRRVDRRDVHFLLRNDDGWKITTIDAAGSGE